MSELERDLDAVVEPAPTPQPKRRLKDKTTPNAAVTDQESTPPKLSREQMAQMAAASSAKAPTAADYKAKAKSEKEKHKTKGGLREERYRER